jgi:hypothetical protein
VAECFTICSSRSRRPVRKLLDTPSYTPDCHPRDYKHFRNHWLHLLLASHYTCIPGGWCQQVCAKFIINPIKFFVVFLYMKSWVISNLDKIYHTHLCNFMSKFRLCYRSHKDDRGFDSRQGLRIFSSPPRPDRLWGPPSLLSDEYQGLFP